MAMLDRKRVWIKDTTTNVNVPNDPAAELMYYLNCMCTVLKLDDNVDINRLRRYDKYARLSHSDRDKLIHICYLLKPELLLNKCIFQDDALCGNMENKFFKLETVRDQYFVTGSVIIGGQQKRVTKIMTFRESWLTDNWEKPMQALIARQEQEKREMEARAQACAGRRCVIQ